MKQKQIFNVVVVGGGTAGWSTAAILSSNEDIAVTVVDPSTIPTIGVGESTLPHMNVAHNAMGFSIFDNNMWLNEVDGTFKFSIYFKDFYQKESSWINPFFVPANMPNSIGYLDTIMPQLTADGEVDLSNYRDQPSYVTDNYCFADMQARGFVEPKEEEPITLASYGGYHLDAGLYGKLLKRESIKRSNVSFIDSEVDSIVGNIDYIVLKDGTKLTADLFVDCTGFSAILMNHVKTEWDDSYKERLFVDTAVAVQLPYINKEKQQRNFTLCHALENGWVWSVPLQSRIGTGYVFSSRHIDPDQAKERFTEYLIDRYGYNENDLSLRTVKFNTGVRRESWKGNAVAVGLSSFFLEPIESTAIAQLQIQAMKINELIKARHISLSNKAKVYNKGTNMALDGIANYIEAHYLFSKRKDSKFWRDVTALPLDSVHQENLNQFINVDTKFDSSVTDKMYQGHSMFNSTTYMFLFLGYDIGPNTTSLKDKSVA
jgi:tryptophan 7-halogenase